MPKTEDDKYKSLSHQTNAIVLTILVALIAGVFFLSTEKGKHLLGFDPDATGSSANQEKFRKNKNPIQESYIVVLKDSVDDIDAKSSELNGKHLGQLKHTYRSALKGFATKMKEVDAMALSEDPSVEYVEEDGYVETSATQTNATWGISRVDSNQGPVSPLDTNYEYTATGSGVNVYVIDTGVLTTHSDFGGRAFTATNTSRDNTPVSQCNGHGTHVAGTIASTTYGIAKNARIYDVRVLGCSGAGEVSDVIAGVDWVTNNSVKPAVANMSLETPQSNSLNSAVNQMVQSGVVAAVAAGNAGTDACGYSPAGASQALTVGATGTTDIKGNFSNYGRCVDLFAPGIAITSTWVNGATNVLNGTSMASPHVAGIAALLLEANPGGTPSLINNLIISGATAGTVVGAGSGSPNLMAYSLINSSGGTTPPPPTSDTTPPQITISSPKAGSVVPKKGQLKLSASASDSSGVGTITLSMNGTVVKVCTGTTSCSANVNAAGILSGTHTVTVTATDKAVPPNTNSTSVTISKP